MLIDAGLQPDAAILKAEIGDRPVHAILVTHGHQDHIAGLPAFGDVPVIAGPGEGPLVRGEVGPGAPMPTLFATLMGAQPYTPPDFREARDGEELVLDGAHFTVVSTPGHTDGSAMYLWSDMLFTGDSLLGHGDSVAPVYWAFATDHAANVASISKLKALDFAHIADGHAGLHRDVKSQVDAF